MNIKEKNIVNPSGIISSLKRVWNSHLGRHDPSDITPDGFEKQKLFTKHVTPNGYILSEPTSYGKKEANRIIKKLKKVDKDPTIALQKAAQIPGFFLPSHKL